MSHFRRHAQLVTDLYWSCPLSSITQHHKVGSGSVENQVFDPGGIYGIAVDQTYLYWADNGTKKIRKAPFTNFALITDLEVGEPNPIGCAVDSTYVYWTNQDTPNGTVYRALKSDGSGRTQLANTQAYPLHCTRAGAYLYWTNYASGGAGIGKLQRSNPDGTGLVTLDSALTGPSSATVGGSDLFVTEYTTGKIWRYALDGSGKTQIATGYTSIIQAVATGTKIYWCFGSLRIYVADHAGVGAAPLFFNTASAPGGMTANPGAGP